MALVLRDRVKETTSTAGTGTYSLAGAVDGFESFGSVGNGNTTYYGCSDGINFEVGIGTYTASGTTLARTTILQSSNSDSAVNWGTGTRTIFCTLPAEKMSFLDASGNLVANNASALTNLNASNITSGTVPIARIDTGTTAGKMIVLDGLARLPAVDGSQLFNVATGPADITADSFTGDNSTTAFTITTAPAAADDLLVTINGLIQRPTTDYTVSGTTLTFTSVPFTGANIFSRLIGGSESTNGDLLAANNLSDLASAATARTNLGVAIGSDVQAHSSVLDGTTASFTTAKDSKLTGIEAGADVTDTTNVAAAGALMDSEVTNLAQVKAFDSSDYATAAQGTTADAALPRTGGAMTGAITTNSTFDGRDVATDGAKLDGIEAGATTDQTAAEIRALVESATDSNVFTDADHTKLNGIEASADVTDAANVEPLVDAHLNTSTASASEVLSWTGSDYDWVAQSGGGASLDLYAESYDGTSTAPSATGTNSVAIGKGSSASGQESMAILDGNSVSQDSFSMGGDVYANAIGGIQIGKGGIVGGYGFAANYGVSIGYQGVAAQGESIAIGKGYSGGTNSFTAQITNNTNTYGATGNNSIALGQLAKATSARGVAIGANAQSSSTSIALNTGWNSMVTSASGSNSVAIGGNTSATSAGSFAFGQQSSSAIRGKYAYAAGAFAAQGDAQGGMYILRADTTDATATVLTTNNSTAAADNQIVAASDTCIMFSGTLVAMQNGAQDQGGWEIKGLLKNDGGTTTLVSSNVQTFADGNGWTVALTADNTNNALAITCTGEAAHNIRWVANISTSEVTYA